MAQGVFLPIVEALNAADVRYVVVGGLAVVLHGHARLTAGLDLVVDLEPAGALAAIRTLLDLGFQPRAPVAAKDFADPTIRRSWIDEKGMRVFSLYDPANPVASVDLFVEHPIPFADLLARAEVPTSEARRRAERRWLAKLRLKRRPMKMPRPELEEWPVGWEAHRRHRLRMALRSTPEQRLAWLEEALRLACESGALARRRRRDREGRPKPKGP